MYLFFIILPLLLLLICLNHWRRKKIIKKICCMCMEEKCTLLKEIIFPFGYCYIPSQDIFSSHLDAWQRELGYTALYDRAAYRLRMVFDSLPVYFDYRGRTWLLECWKGQYGITTGGEIGLYYAQRILQEEELANTVFQCVDNPDMAKMSFTLTRGKDTLAQLAAKHWWLTAFRLGDFSQPANLKMQASVLFPSSEMAVAFARGLMRAGYAPSEFCVRCHTVFFCFDRCEPVPGKLRRLRIWIAQMKNRFWCKMYLFITRPFCLAIDRVLYLYFYLPFAFRRTMRIKKCKRG